MFRIARYHAGTNHITADERRKANICKEPGSVGAQRVHASDAVTRCLQEEPPFRRENDVKKDSAAHGGSPEREACLFHCRDQIARMKEVQERCQDGYRYERTQ